MVSESSTFCGFSWSVAQKTPVYSRNQYHEYPLVNKHKLNMAIDIVDFPINSMVDLSIANC